MKDSEQLQNENLPKTEFAAKLNQVMTEQGLTIDDIREITQSTYETARRFVRGISSPSQPVAKLVAQHFKWDLKEVQGMIIRDRERVKHGDLLDVAHSVDPDITKVTRSWPLLTKAQKKVVLETIAGFISRNRTV